FSRLLCYLQTHCARKIRPTLRPIPYDLFSSIKESSLRCSIGEGGEDRSSSWLEQEILRIDSMGSLRNSPHNIMAMESHERALAHRVNQSQPTATTRQTDSGMMFLP